MNSFWQTVGHRVLYDFSSNVSPLKLLEDIHEDKPKLEQELKNYLKDLAASFGDDASLFQEIDNFKIFHLVIEEHNFIIFDIPPQPVEVGDLFCTVNLITIGEQGNLISRYFMMVLGVDNDTNEHFVVYAENTEINKDPIVHATSQYYFFGLFIDQILKILNEKFSLLRQYIQQAKDENMHRLLYFAAHYFLYDALFTDNPEDKYFLLEATVKERGKLLQWIKSSLLNFLEQPSEFAAKLIESIDISFIYVENLSIVIVHLPTPQQKGEAFEIAVVYQIDGFKKEYSSVRYFTSELGVKIIDAPDGGNETYKYALYICEWQGREKEKTHLNYGFFEYFNLAIFIDSILELYYIPIKFFQINFESFENLPGVHSEANFSENKIEFEIPN